MRAEISVVIPTVGRARKLAATLASLGALQKGAPAFETIVVLDGDDAGSREVSDAGFDFPLVTLSQPRAGIAAARNLGSAHATAPLVLFLNDDTRVAPDCLTHHVVAQGRGERCITLGRIDWDPETVVTPYMNWLAPAGHQFNYTRLNEAAPVPWDACWGTNLAVPREWLLDERFDTGNPYLALEDGEWGYRQTLRGRRIRYVPEARCFHHHRYDGPADYRGRALTAGAAARHVVRRHPQLAYKLLVRPLLAAAASTAMAVWPARWRRSTMWDLDFRWSYVVGMASRQRRHRIDFGVSRPSS